MNNGPRTTDHGLRRLVYTLLITVAAAAVAGRILAVISVQEPYRYRDETDPTDPRSLWPRTRPQPTPTLGGNDRSRWATVRALVDEGTYRIGHRTWTSATEYQDHGIMTEDGWKTLDQVLHPQRQEFYSSKPPLLPTLVAGEYWLLKQLLGWSITEQRFEVMRTILLTVNWLPLVVYLLLLARLVERLGTTDWGRLYVLAAGGFGTFLTPFAVALNNHSVATCSALFALYPALRIWYGTRPALAGGARRNGATTQAPNYLFALAGFFAAFTACMDLPAAALTAALFAVLLVRAPGRTLAYFAPAAAVPVAAFLLTNYLALGRLTPAYGEFGGPWYEYPGSYWRQEPGKEKRGIDWAYQKETKAAYAFHFLLGHHGLFALTPMYLLGVAGIVRGLRRRDGPGEPAAGPSFALPAVLTLVLTVVVVGFYLVRTGNYGGWTAGPRWLMWLTPLWLVMMLPVADRLAGRRWGRGLAYVLLALSVLSASYPAWNPWRHPWLYHLLEARGWVPY